MVNTCCVPGCKTGYKSHKNHPKTALFQFPSKEVLKNKWLKSIPRKNCTLSSSHRVCAKHFHANNIITKSTNIFNDFLNKQKFNIPANGHENLIGSSCFPSFSHLRHVYTLEESKVLKIAHVLNKPSLNPSSIARTSPNHARGVYNILCCHDFDVNCYLNIKIL